MPTFTRTDKYDKQKGYQRVLWGDKSKVLDTELTELQKIIEGKMDDLGSFIMQNGFLNKPALTYAAGTLTVPVDTLFYNGRMLPYEDPMTIAVGASTTVYLAISEVEIAYTDTIYRDGNMSGGTEITDNGIYDSTIGIETSRRVQLQLELVTDNSDGTKDYFPVATLDASSVVTDNRVLCVSNLTPAQIGAVSKSGDTMTGTLTLAANPVNDLDAATKVYVDQQMALARTYVP